MQLLIILFFSFLIRMLFILGETSDELFHLWFLKKAEKYKIGRYEVEESVIPGYYGYPYLFYLFISMFNRQKRIMVGYFSNIIFDCLSIAVVYFFTSYLFNKLWIINNADAFISPAIAVTLLYSTSPILFSVSARLRTIGSRTLGGLLILLYFISLFFAFSLHFYFCYLLCFMLAILIILSSQFAFQVLFFFSLGLSLFYIKIEPLITVALAIMFTYVVKFLGGKEILKTRINHSLWYLRNYHNDTTATGRNKLRDFLLMPAYFFKNKTKFFECFFSKITPLIAAYSVIPLSLMIFYFIKDHNAFRFLLDNPITYYFLSLILTSLIIFILTSKGPLLAFGQAERYFEYSLPYIILIYLLFILQNKISYSQVIWVLLLNLIFIFLNFLMITKNFYLNALSIGSLNKDFFDLVKFLENLPGTHCFLSIPVKLNFGISAFLDKTGNRFYFNFISREKIDGFIYMDKDNAKYNFIKPDFKYFKSKYKLDMLIIEKNVLSHSDQTNRYSLEGRHSLYENNTYAVFDINNFIS